MVILNKYKIVDIKKFKRFIFLSTFIISICAFIFLFTTNAYSKDIPKYEYVIVQNGDTLWSIASNYVNDGDIRDLIYKIKRENNIVDAKIHPNDIIRIPLFEVK